MQAIRRWQTEQHDSETLGETQTNRVSGQDQENWSRQKSQEIKSNQQQFFIFVDFRF